MALRSSAVECLVALRPWDGACSLDHDASTGTKGASVEDGGMAAPTENLSPFDEQIAKEPGWRRNSCVNEMRASADWSHPDAGLEAKYQGPNPVSGAYGST